MTGMPQPRAGRLRKALPASTAVSLAAAPIPARCGAHRRPPAPQPQGREHRAGDYGPAAESGT